MEIMKVITSIGRRAPHRDGAVEANRAARATDKFGKGFHGVCQVTQLVQVKILLDNLLRHRGDLEETT